MKKAILILLFGTITTLLVSDVQGQSAQAAISGVIADTSGAVLPDARVTVTEVNTGFSRETRTDQSGRYSLPLLPIGTYRLVAEAEGFRRAQRSGVVLHVQQEARIDFLLSVGGVVG